MVDNCRVEVTIVKGDPTITELCKRMFTHTPNRRAVRSLGMSAVMVSVILAKSTLPVEAASLSPIPVGQGPAMAAYDAANGDMYVANYSSSTVSVIDGSTNTVTKTITVGSRPIGVAYDVANGDVYVVNNFSSSVSVIDGSTNTVTSTIKVGDRPFGVAYDAKNGDVYVANNGSTTVSVIDGSTNKVTSTISVGTWPIGVAYDAKNGDVYVAIAGPGSDSVSVIDGSTNKVTGTIPVSRAPYGVAYDPANSDVYVVNDFSSSVSVIDGSTNTVTSNISVGSSPSGVAYDPANGDVYVANNGSTTVSVIDGSTNTVTSTIKVGANPYYVVYDVANGDVYVTNSGDNTVSVIVPPLPTITKSSVVQGSTIGTTAIRATPNTVGDTFAVQVTSNLPSVGPGASVPSGATTYKSDTNISNVAVGDVVTLYEVNSGSVVADTSYTLTKSDILGATITYDGNGASGAAPTDSSQYMVGASATLAGQGNLIKTGYTFAGWNTKADGSGTSYAANSTLIMPATKTTLYAQWTANTYALGYSGNGSTSGSVPNGSNPTYNTAVTVYGNTGNLQRTGYTFAGWNTKADGSGTSYASGSTLTIGASSVTLYAQWTADATAVPSGLGHSNVTQTGWTETWAPVSNASSYDVYLNGTQVGTTAQSVYSYAFSKETPGTTYKVQVSSVNAANQASTKSAPDSVTTVVYGGGGPIPPVIIQDFFPEPAQVGERYFATIHDIGGTDPMRWSVTSGSLPAGLSLDNQGVISGTPTTAGTYTFTAKVTDANHLSSTKQLTLTVNGPTPPTTPVSVTTGKDHSVFIGHAVNLQLQASGGQTPYTWSVVGALPKGLQLNSTTGMLSGTPDKSGVDQVTVRVTGAQGTTSEQTITLDVLHNYEREVLWNGNVKNVPAVVRKEGTTYTTYMPIWYVMQLLKPMGITSTWDGKHWHMTTTTAPNVSNVQAGSGNTGIYLNGALVQMVNTVAQNDPWTNKPTTYMPIWYVMQLLKRVGLQSTWNGTTWTVTK